MYAEDLGKNPSQMIYYFLPCQSWTSPPLCLTLFLDSLGHHPLPLPNSQWLYQIQALQEIQTQLKHLLLILETQDVAVGLLKILIQEHLYYRLQVVGALSSFYLFLLFYLVVCQELQIELWVGCLVCT